MASNGNAKKQMKTSRERSEFLWGWLFILPTVIGLVIFTKFLKSPAEAVSSFVTYFTRAVPVVVLVISIIGVVWFFSILTTLLHQYREDIRPERNVCKRGGRFHILKRIVTLVAAVVILTMFTETELGGSFIYQTYTRPKIVAPVSYTHLTLPTN